MPLPYSFLLPTSPQLPPPLSFPTRRSSDLHPHAVRADGRAHERRRGPPHPGRGRGRSPAAHQDRKSTRLNSSHVAISYAVFCLKKKKKQHSTESHNNHNTVNEADTREHIDE